MKRLLLGLTVVAGLAIGAVPVADAAPDPSRCSKRELKGAKGEGIGASDIVNGGGSYIEVATSDTTSERRFSMGIDLAADACAAISYTVVVTDPTTGNELYRNAVTGLVGGTSVTLASGVTLADGGDAINVVVTSSSAVNPLIDRAPNSGVNSIAIGSGGGQGWN